MASSAGTDEEFHTNDIGDLKGMVMEDSTIRRAPAIASDMGLAWIRTLGMTEEGAIAELAERTGVASGISRDHMRSFKVADLVMEVRDPASNEVEYRYVLVEVTYTGDSRDVARVVRSSRYLTKFTNTPTHAVIASVRNDWDIDHQLARVTQPPIKETGATLVYWWKSPEPSRQ